MGSIRSAEEGDLNRIAEIEVFNYRMYFYPIFKSDIYYFSMLQTPALAERYEKRLAEFRVYDDGVVKGFIQVADGELKKLFVEPVLHGLGVGGKLLDYAVERENARFLWALEKNNRAIEFYKRKGFRVTGDKKPVDDTAESLVRLESG